MKQPASFGVVFRNGKCEVLLLRRKDVAVWTLPGGGINSNETPETAVIRELFEETGLHVAITRKVALYTPINSLSSPTHLYECATIGGELRESDESAGLQFWPLDTLPSSFFFLHHEWLKDALEQKPEVIHRVLSSVTYLKLFKEFLRHPLRVMRFALTRLLHHNS